MNRHFVAGIRTLAVVFILALFAMAQAANPGGEWNLQSDAQGTITKFTLTITKVGEVLKGKVVSEAYGTQDLTDLKFENATVTFTRNLDLGGQTIPMAFKGKIEGDKMAGAYTIQEFEIPVTGSRKTLAPAK